jgi:hypothetical protein
VAGLHEGLGTQDLQPTFLGTLNHDSQACSRGARSGEI